MILAFFYLSLLLQSFSGAKWNLPTAAEKTSPSLSQPPKAGWNSTLLKTYIARKNSSADQPSLRTRPRAPPNAKANITIPRNLSETFRTHGRVILIEPFLRTTSIFTIAKEMPFPQTSRKSDWRRRKDLSVEESSQTTCSLAVKRIPSRALTIRTKRHWCSD